MEDSIDKSVNKPEKKLPVSKHSSSKSKADKSNKQVIVGKIMKYIKLRREEDLANDVNDHIMTNLKECI